MSLLERMRRDLFALPWPEFFESLPAYLEAKASVKVQRIGVRLYLCSLYVSPSRFDVWIACDPKTLK